MCNSCIRRKVLSYERRSFCIFSQFSKKRTWQSSANDFALHRRTVLLLLFSARKKNLIFRWQWRTYKIWALCRRVFSLCILKSRDRVINYFHGLCKSLYVLSDFRSEMKVNIFRSNFSIKSGGKSQIKFFIDFLISLDCVWMLSLILLLNSKLLWAYFHHALFLLLE